MTPRPPESRPTPSAISVPRHRPALTLLRRLLLLPLLAPLLAVLLVAAFNPRPLVSMRLLTARSAALPLGVWLAAGGGAGALLSSLATALALREGRRSGGRSGAAEPGTWLEDASPFDRSSQGTQPPSRRNAPPPPEPTVWSGAGPERAPGDPPPTVSVPFRVIRRASRAASVVPDSAAPATPGSPVSAAVVRDDWGDTGSDEEW